MIIKIVNEIRKIYWFLVRPNTVGVRVILIGPNSTFVLVRHRYDPLLYLPGGKLRKNETPEAGAVREIKEELGIILDPKELKLFGKYKNDSEYKKDTVFVFAANTSGTPKPSSFEIKEVLTLEENDLSEADLSLGTKYRLDEFLCKRPRSESWSGLANFEHYEGNNDDRRLISEYLTTIRSVRPVEICSNPNAYSLKEILEDKKVPLEIDREFLKRCLDIAEKEIKQISKHAKLFPLDRFLLSDVKDPKDLGGFHSPLSLGYQYFLDAAYVAILNTRLVNNERLVVYEIMRGFIHDSLHQSTYRTFRRKINIPKGPHEAKHSKPEVYRYQYGINFRTKDGIAFSSGSATNEVPQKINVNLLMDGVVVLKAAEVVKKLTSQLGIHFDSSLDKSIFDEIVLENLTPKDLPASVSVFNQTVVEPTKKFIEHWGGNEVMNLIIDAMMSGQLDRLKKFFAEKTGDRNFWDNNFKQEKFEYEIL